jgi:hypothetical protein
MHAFVSQGNEGCGTPRSFNGASSKLRCRAEGLSTRPSGSLTCHDAQPKMLG